MKQLLFTAGLASRRLSLNVRQRSLAANTMSNLTILLIGFSMTNQPLASLSMSEPLRGSMIVTGIALFGAGLWFERSDERRSR